MAGKKSTKEKKRRHSEARHEGERKRRSTESSVEVEADTRPDAEEPSDIEEGGLDLKVPFKPISAYVSQRRQMLEQCFHVLGDNKLHKMLPDELKDCTCEEIKQLCWDQLEKLSQSKLLHILEGEEVTGCSDPEEEENGKKKVELNSQQDNNVDSTSSVKEPVDHEDKQGSGDESDVLSINADTYDSDIEGPKEDPTEKAGPKALAPPTTADPKRELQSDIDRSVCEILAHPHTPKDTDTPTSMVQSQPVIEEATPIPGAEPSVQQLELLELEMRARAIKALMKANEVKKQSQSDLDRNTHVGL